MARGGLKLELSDHRVRRFPSTPHMSTSIKKHSTYICAEFNIDLLKLYIKQHYTMLLDIVTSSGFHPKVTFLTSITDTSNSPIDNILTNVYDDNQVSGIFINKDIRSSAEFCL